MMVLVLGVIDLARQFLLADEQLREIEPLGFPVRHQRRLVEHLGLAHHLVESAVAECGHDLADLFRDEEEVIDDVLGLPGEALAQQRDLGRNPDRTGVEVALAHHDAAGRDQRGGSETELVGPKQRADHHVASGAEAPSTWTTMRLRSRSRTRVWWVSARPISQGLPACLIEVSGDAPVPPSKPAMVT